MVDLFAEHNSIPLLALIVEPLIAAFMMMLSFNVYRKYKERPQDATLYLTLGLGFYALGVVSSVSGKFVDYFRAEDTSVSNSDFGIALAYCLTALSNVAMMAFVDSIFIRKQFKLTILVGVFNGFTIGSIATRLSNDPELYDSIFPYVTYHVLVSFVCNGIIIYFSFREARRATEKLPQIGYRMIGTFGILASLVFLLFAIDIGVLGGDYSFAYYTAWGVAGLASLAGYLGYVMPDWFKNRVMKK